MKVPQFSTFFHQISHQEKSAPQDYKRLNYSEWSGQIDVKRAFLST
jgi:hypothetical protein